MARATASCALVKAVIARSVSDEAIQTVPAETFWIASPALAMTAEGKQTLSPSSLRTQGPITTG
jgi:hypothetical protein